MKDFFSNFLKTMKERKKLVIISSISLFAIAIFLIYLFEFDGYRILFTSKSEIEANKTEVKELLSEYMQNLKDKKYSDMYKTLHPTSKACNARSTFVDRHKKIYEGIGMKNYEVKIDDDVDLDDKKMFYTVKYKTSMDTYAGKVSFDNSVVYEKIEPEDEDEESYWGMKWDYNVIYPDLKFEYKIKTSIIEPLRGAILDRNGKKLAYTKKKNPSKRIYPQGEAFCHVVGWVGDVTAEDLKELDPAKYDEKSKIGKKGLEYAFEDELRGKQGCKIAVTDKSGGDIKVIAKTPVTNGKNIKTTLDIKYQKAAYKNLKNKMAANICMNAKTGEVLALVSTPTYNPTTQKSKAPESKSPFLNRFARAYCPGSSFKPLNAGIGLTTGAYNESTNYDYSGKEYTRPEWGNFTIRTTSNYGKDHTLKNALTYSDNIYFGRAALDIGKKRLMKGLDKLGFGKIFPFDIKPQQASIYAVDKDNCLNSDAEIANTGFGQGELLVNPVHMASIYSAFLKNGNMVMPYLKYRKKPKAKYYKKNVFSKSVSKRIAECLKSVVQNGTATAAKGAAVSMAGKTGTAELKARRGESGDETGWFCGYTYNTKKPIVYATMIEKVPTHSTVVEKTRDIINDIY